MSRHPERSEGSVGVVAYSMYALVALVRDGALASRLLSASIPYARRVDHTHPSAPICVICG